MVDEGKIKYYLVPVTYIACLVLVEYSSNFIVAGLGFAAVIAGIVAAAMLIVNRRERTPSLRVVLILLVLIPTFDLSFGISNSIRNAIKGDVVFSVMDDSVVSAKVLTIRKLGIEFHGEYDFSAVGFGDVKRADIEIRGDTVSFAVPELNYRETLVYDRSHQIMRSQTSNSQYRILINQLIN